MTALGYSITKVKDQYVVHCNLKGFAWRYTISSDSVQVNTKEYDAIDEDTGEPKKITIEYYTLKNTSDGEKKMVDSNATAKSMSVVK